MFWVRLWRSKNIQLRHTSMYKCSATRNFTHMSKSSTDIRLLATIVVSHPSRILFFFCGGDLSYVVFSQAACSVVFNKIVFSTTPYPNPLPRFFSLIELAQHVVLPHWNIEKTEENWTAQFDPHLLEVLQVKGIVNINNHRKTYMTKHNYFAIHPYMYYRT